MATRHNLQITFGSNLRLARENAGLTQEELAARAKLKSKSYVGMLERGERSPSFDVLIRLLDILAVPPDTLFVDGGNADSSLPRIAIAIRRIEARGNGELVRRLAEFLEACAKMKETSQ